MAADQRRQLELAGQALEDVLDARLGSQVLDHDGELVATDASDRVTGTHGPGEANGRILRELVADVVTDRVVDGFARVEIDVDQRKAVARLVARERCPPGGLVIGASLTPTGTTGAPESPGRPGAAPSQL